MADGDVQYETKVVQAVRGMEARARAKAEAEGWELSEQKSGSVLRSTLSFRRPKKKISPSAWIVGATAAAVLIGIVLVGASLERANGPAADMSPRPSETSVSAASPNTAATTSAVVETPVQDPSLSDTEVLDALNDFFAERAAAGVLFGKAVRDVTFAEGVVRVTFDPAAAGVSTELFDSMNPFENMAEFAATPICFADAIGNRVRPAVNSIETVRADGAPMGTYSRADILALNGLEK